MKKAVFILSKENCSKCAQAKEELSAKGLNIIEIGVDHIDLPIILDSKIYSGYDPKEWDD